MLLRVCVVCTDQIIGCYWCSDTDQETLQVISCAIVKRPMFGG